MKLDQEARFMFTFALACLFVHLHGWLAAAAVFALCGVGAVVGAAFEIYRRWKLKEHVRGLLMSKVVEHATERRKATGVAMRAPKQSNRNEVAH